MTATTILITPTKKQSFFNRLKNSELNGHYFVTGGDCCKTPRSRHSSQHYRRLLSVSEDNVGETKRRNRYFATVPGSKTARYQ